MPTYVNVGNKVKEIELLDLFPSEEGQIAQYYGRIGNGKTYAATADVLEFLRKGKVVYVNWPINYTGYDERASRFRVFVTLIFPWLKRFYYFPKSNLRYFEFSDLWSQRQTRKTTVDADKLVTYYDYYEDFSDWFASRTDCQIFGDEGHVMFDSYVATRMSIEKRAAILHTRHFNRSINIISQRPTAIHVAMRANVNVFYKCEKVWQFGNIVRFRRVEFQDMMNETVDEDEEKIVDIKRYWGSKKIFEAYDTKYLRKGMNASQKVEFEAYDVGYWTRLKLLFGIAHKKEEPKPEKSQPVDKLSILLETKPQTAIVIHRSTPTPYRRLNVQRL